MTSSNNLKKRKPPSPPSNQKYRCFANSCQNTKEKLHIRNSTHALLKCKWSNISKDRVINNKARYSYPLTIILPMSRLNFGHCLIPAQSAIDTKRAVIETSKIGNSKEITTRVLIKKSSSVFPYLFRLRQYFL